MSIDNAEEIILHTQEDDNDGKMYYCCARHGRMTILCGNREKMFPYQFLVGPDWPCMIVTYSFVIVPTVLFMIYVGPKLHWTVQILAGIIGISTVLSFSIIACSDPGIIFQDHEAVGDEPAGVMCAQCHVRRPFKAMHCYDCEVCVEEENA